MKSNALKGYLMILASAVGFGSYGVWSIFIGSEFGVFFQGWVRSALVLLILIPVAVISKSFKRIDKRDIWWILVPVIFGVFTQAPLYYAFVNSDIGTATLIFYATYVVTSYVVGKVYMGEKINGAKIISLILALVGLFLIFGLSLAKFSILALILAAVNGVASGGEVSTTKKSSQKYPSLQIGVYVWIGILVTHLPASILAGESQIPFQLNFVWYSMIAFAAVGLVSFWLVIEGYKYVDASIGGLIGLIEIIAAVMFGIWIFDEGLSPAKVLGGAIILLAAMLPDLSAIFSKKKV